MGLLSWLVGDSEKNQEIVKDMAYVIGADGKATDEEFAVLSKYMASIGFSGIGEDDMKKGFEAVARGETPDFSKFSDKEKKSLLNACAQVALADNEVTEDEMKVIFGLAALMGYTEEDLKNMCK